MLLSHTQVLVEHGPKLLAKSTLQNVTQPRSVDCPHPESLQASAIGKVVVSAPQPAWSELRTAAASSTAGGSILITGGTGALGLLVASWLVGQQGVGQVVLLTRSGKPAQTTADSPAQRQLQTLLCSSAAVHIMAADTAASADRSAVAAMVREQFGGSLAGIVHAAGVLEDAALSNQTLTGLRR